MKNAIKSKVQGGEQVIGMFCVFGGATAVECLGIAGLDFLIADTEHGMLDVESVLPQVIAAERRNITPFVRVKDATRPSVLKMLDIGAAGLIVPYIQTIAEVRELVQFAKYAPVGSRGYGIVRASGFGFADYARSITEYFALSNAETLLIPQCETAGCLQDIEAIAALEGVDGIFVGPYDLSVALGVPGQMDAPVLNEAIARVLNACRAANKLSFIFSGNVEIARRYFALGYDAVACGVDCTVLTQAVKNIAAQIRA